jgi:hypothetical protein
MHGEAIDYKIVIKARKTKGALGGPNDRPEGKVAGMKAGNCKVVN